MNDLELKAIAMQDKPRSLAPNHLGRSTSALYSMLLSSGFPKHFGRVTTLDVDANFSYVAPIRTMRKVGDDGIFLEWDVAHRPDNVVGYEVRIHFPPGRLSGGRCVTLASPGYNFRFW